MLTEENAREIVSIIKNILERYKRYEKLIRYPGDWGERAFRFWLASEVIHSKLEWPVENIIFGERYDILLVDKEIVPKVYIETKKPETPLGEEMLKEAIKRANSYYSIWYIILTNGTHWVLYDNLKNSKKYASIECDDFESWLYIFKSIHASNLL